MTLREVLKKIEAMPFKRSEKARITRGSWKGFGWYITPGLLQDRLWWSHMTPLLPYAATYADLVAQDWKVVFPRA